MSKKIAALAAVSPEFTAGLAQAVKAAEKKSGLESILTNRKADATVTATTGCLMLDYIMGGGIPSGRIIGISGDEHLGKSVLATQIASEQLEASRYAVMFDAEGTSSPEFLAKRGIDFDSYRGERNKKGILKPGQSDQIFFYQPHTGDQLKHYMSLLCSGLPEDRSFRPPPLIFLLDSVISLISDEIYNKVDGNTTAMHARMYAELLPIISGHLVRTGSTFVYTNQIRDDVGNAMGGFGDKEKEPAGRALKFFSSARIRLTKYKPKLANHNNKDHPFIDGFIPSYKPKAGGSGEELTNGQPNGIFDRYRYTGMSTIKNKAFTPFKSCWMRIMYEEAGETGSGIDPVFDVFSLLHELDLIQKGKNKQTFVLKPNDDVAGLADLIPADFDYYEFKKHVRSAGRGLITQLRELLLMSGFAYQGYTLTNDVAELEEIAKANHGEIPIGPPPV